MIESDSPMRPQNFPCKKRAEEVEKKEIVMGFFLKES
jgi:hypothetical protein